MIGCKSSGRRDGSGAWCSIASNTPAVVLPLKGTVPVAISFSTTPNEKISVRASKTIPRACSGDM
jgi:hypothetical protein